MGAAFYDHDEVVVPREGLGRPTRSSLTSNLNSPDLSLGG
jgi:hypothetical protein